MTLPNLLAHDNHESRLKAVARRPAAHGKVDLDLSWIKEQGQENRDSAQAASRMMMQLLKTNEELEKRVESLTRDLAQAKQQGGHELVEKERFAQRLSTLLSLLPAGVVVLDGKGRVQQCNPAAIDLLGEPLEGERWGHIIERCFAPRADDGHEISLKDGRRVSISTRSMESEPGQLILLHDMTETRELQAQVSRNERLSSMGRMVASLAHQIRTPLSAAMLYGGHLLHPDLAPELRVKCAEKLMSRLAHLDQQVRDMLIFARGETRLAEQMSMGDLADQLKSAAEAGLLRSGAACEWQIDAPAAQILCNKDALLGALLNLMHNGIESSSGTPRLQVRMSQVDGVVQIEVADQGAGFTPEQQDRIMEAFYTTKPQGTGLGLAVVQAVVKAHQGSFRLVSEGVGQGARAIISLPLHSAPVTGRVASVQA